MELGTDPHAIAARIRGLIGGQDQGIIERIARRLGVSAMSLRLSVDDDEPTPTIDVLNAMVRVYGVDPTWLITGEYDAASHRVAVESEARHTGVEVAKLVARIPGAPPGGGPALGFAGTS
jgi:transcriptional regulator with XRE-family HTH domain